MLEGLGLKPGANECAVNFKVSQGVEDAINIQIYLYNWSDKLIISDIDGTITK